ncbi:hypothetical protein RHGRI_000862 [Rhododendron griersonianum]|uniref:Protein kinase domain-containing protein n=1 Tax=Rhododendron griersonianum TaxID=479676 RepID=A0AAV6LKC9_9ERIC|nr:hypothetical protein RHGRI_000862 [Rhododendron griersonianum]
MDLDMELGDYPKQFAYEDLQLLTDNFDVRNVIGRTQFCKVYRGKIPQGWNEMQEQDVTVKIWADTVMMKGEIILHPAVAHNVFRFFVLNWQMTRPEDEITFLTYPSISHHPNLAKLMGYLHDEDHFGVVYDLKPLDTVCNFIAEGTFTWMDRIKVIFQLARLLEYLHGQTPQYLVRNFSAAHIMVDQVDMDLNPVLFEFGMLTGGMIGMKDRGLSLYPFAAYGYTDPVLRMLGVWTDRTDVFTFGVVLLELLCKCAVDGIGCRENSIVPNFLYGVAQEIYDTVKSRCFYEQSRILSLVHRSFRTEAGYDTGDGLKLAKLAMKCVQMDDERPSMGEVVEHLKTLHVIRNYAELLLLGP